MMKEQLEAIRKSALEAIAGTKAAAELDALRVKYLGKKGELTAVLKLIGSLSACLLYTSIPRPGTPPPGGGAGAPSCTC